MMSFGDVLDRAQWQIKHNRKLVVMTAVTLAILALEAAVFFNVNSRLKTSQALLKDKIKEMELARTTGLSQISPQELGKLQQRINSFKEGFVKADEISTAINRLSDLAEKNNVRVLSINSEEPQPVKTGEAGAEETPAYKRLPTRMRLEGNYRSFAEFLYALSQSSRKVFVVESYEMRVPEESEALNCEMVLSFFSNG